MCKTITERSNILATGMHSISYRRANKSRPDEEKRSFILEVNVNTRATMGYSVSGLVQKEHLS
jgi:hypothetical protein